MNPTSDISNNTPPTDEPTTDIQDIDVSLNVNNNNDTIDNTINNYPFKSDIENGLNGDSYSTKLRTPYLASSPMKYSRYDSSENTNSSQSSKISRLMHENFKNEPFQIPEKNFYKGRSTFRSILMDVSDRNSVSDYYSDKQKSKWLNNTKVPQISIRDYFMFYFNSLRNNKQYKFGYIEYVGELKTINEFCDNIIGLLLDQLEEEKSVASSSDDASEDMLTFLNDYNDKLTECFHKIDNFLINNIGFMKLCSAPVDLFLDKYYSARNNSCGLIKHTQFASSYDCLCREEVQENYYYISYVECVDKNIKSVYKSDLENQIYMHCSTRKAVSIRRIAAIHTLFGELWALCEFIKTTIELNDQLLFKVIMLCGNFLVLLGEYVWNTTLKERYAD